MRSFLTKGIPRTGISISKVCLLTDTMNFAILLILSWLVAILGEDTGCTQSLPTIAFVKNCPRSKQEWIARAQMKRCDIISQDCTKLKTDFVYHCLLNEWGNATLEVCAAKRNVIGNCAEFNSGGRKIQNSIVPCEQCPDAYLSTTAYKYSECYDHVLKGPPKKVEENRSKGQNLSENGSSAAVGGLTLALVLLQFILMSIIVVVLVKCFKKRSTHSRDCAQGEESDPLIQHPDPCADELSCTDEKEDKGKCNKIAGDIPEDLKITTSENEDQLIKLDDADTIPLKCSDKENTEKRDKNKGNGIQNTNPEVEDHLITLDDPNPGQLTCSSDAEKNEAEKHVKEDTEK